MAGFRKNELRKVSKEMMNRIRKNKQRYANEATALIQQSVKFYDVFDTGNLRRASKGEVFVFDKSAIIRFKTDGGQADYWMYPRNGLGTSRNYGPRKYDILAGENFIKRYKLKRK